MRGLCVLVLALALATTVPRVAGAGAVSGGGVSQMLSGTVNSLLACIGQSIEPKPLAEVKAQLFVDKAKLEVIAKALTGEMQSGLNRNSDSSLKMLPSHLTGSPNGQEKGDFLALDLGGTNFRVLKVTLEGNGKYSVDAGKFKVEESIMTGPGKDLFAFIAQKIKEQVPEAVDAPEPLPMGFTFSFPVEQPTLDSGTLVNWTKGFTCAGVEGQDVVAMLKKAIADEKLNIKVTALVNDTPGTMLAGAYTDPSVCAGLILGTGTNMCYMEKVAKAPKLQATSAVNKLPSVVTWNQPPHLGGHSGHIINMEWGNFGAGSSHESLPWSAYDAIVDRQSPNPGSQLFEKIISGMYLGEITRLAVTDLISKEVCFQGQAPKLFLSPGEFNTELMAFIEGSSSTSQIQERLKQHGVTDASQRDCSILKSVCTAVSTRAARVSAAGIASIARRIDRVHDCTVAVDGTVFLKYPHFSDRMTATLREMLGKNMGVRFTTASDGSGVGAALAAATVA
mmetsp:Transcript_27372/g.69046  ORF Transcript_27372/g.69046 Transcript_27372/m.69046 type:complete len:507 (+) Transcript_27372:44-1564(+)